MITGRQIRAARGFLAWDRRDLAKNAVVTLYTIERLETGGDTSGAGTNKALTAIKATLEAKRHRIHRWRRRARCAVAP
jgi:hypothetical protein